MNKRRESDLSPYEEEYRGFEIGDDESARGPLILALAIGVLIVFAAVVWNTYRQGVRGNDGELPMITAEAEPYKRVPDERGGIEIDDLDRRLYDAMDGSTRPPAAQPAAANLQTGLLAGPPRDLRPSASGGSNRVATGDVEAEDLPPIDATPRDEVETSTRHSETDLSVQPEPQEPKPSLSGQPDTGLSFTPGGQFLVQISAVRSEAAANDAWTRLTGQHPEIFGGASKLIERADLGAKGVFFRLRAGRFGTREGAAEFCTAYKQAGGDCIVVREST